MLACPKCGHTNDIGRIFCIDCGQKLDLSRVGIPGGVLRMRRKGKKGVPFGKQLSTVIQKFSKIVILAAVAAFLTLLYLPPDFQNRGFNARNFETFQGKRDQLANAIDEQQKMVFVFSEEDLNAGMNQAIQNTLSIQETGSKSKGVKLEGAHFSLGKDNVLITIQQKWNWFHFSTRVQARPKNMNNKWQFRIDQIWIGRFPLPSFLPREIKNSIISALNPLWKNFETEHEWLEQLQSIEIQPGRLIVTTKARSY